MMVDSEIFDIDMIFSIVISDICGKHICRDGNIEIVVELWSIKCCLHIHEVSSQTEH